MTVVQELIAGVFALIVMALFWPVLIEFLVLIVRMIQ